MWDSTEARQKIDQMLELLGRTAQQFRIVGARGTMADRALVTGTGIEVLCGLTDAFEIDREFRNKMRVLAARWVADEKGPRELDQLFATVLISLERLELIVRTL